MSNVFSKRSSDERLSGHYLLSEETRNRILQLMGSDVDNWQAFTQQMANLLVCEYGSMRRSGFEAARRSNVPAEEHILLRRCASV